MNSYLRILDFLEFIDDFFILKYISQVWYIDRDFYGKNETDSKL